MPRRSVFAATVACNIALWMLVFPSIAQRYLSWLNGQLLGVRHVEDISDSLADGVLMIEALVVGTPHSVFIALHTVIMASFSSMYI